MAIYHTAIPIDISSTDFTLPRSCSAILAGAGGALFADMADIKSAEAYVTVSPSGTITAITLAYQGLGYVSAPTVTIFGGAFRSNTETDATATCTVANGQVQPAFTITNAGTGYSALNPPQVKFTGGIGSGGIHLIIPAGVSSISVKKVYRTSTTATGLFALYI